MRLVRFTISVVATLPLLCWAPRASEGADGAEQRMFALRTAEIMEIATVPVNRDSIFVSQAAGKKIQERKVVLIRRSYRCHSFAAPDGKEKEKTSHIQTYELSSTDRGEPLCWALCADRILGNFRLCTNERGENYLTCIRGGNVAVFELSRPADRVEALLGYINARNILPLAYVPVRDLIPLVRLWGVNSFFSDISVESVHKEADGSFTISISGPDKDKTYTIAGQGTSWHLK